MAADYTRRQVTINRREWLRIMGRLVACGEMGPEDRGWGCISVGISV
jgi:hypothetical protein